MFYEGEGTKVDYDEAFGWFGKAAEQGHADAMFQIANMLAQGHGFPQSIYASLYWLQKSAAAGNETAAEFFPSMCSTMAAKAYSKGEPAGALPVGSLIYICRLSGPQADPAFFHPGFFQKALFFQQLHQMGVGDHPQGDGGIGGAHGLADEGEGSHGGALLSLPGALPPAFLPAGYDFLHYSMPGRPLPETKEKTALTQKKRRTSGPKAKKAPPPKRGRGF